MVNIKKVKIITAAGSSELTHSIFTIFRIRRCRWRRIRVQYWPIMRIVNKDLVKAQQTTVWLQYQYDSPYKTYKLLTLSLLVTATILGCTPSKYPIVTLPGLIGSVRFMVNSLFNICTTFLLCYLHQPKNIIQPSILNQHLLLSNVAFLLETTETRLKKSKQKKRWEYQVKCSSILEPILYSSMNNSIFNHKVIVSIDNSHLSNSVKINPNR